MKSVASPTARSLGHGPVLPGPCAYYGKVARARKCLWVTPAAAEAEIGTLHTVQTGETLAQIALAYGVSVEQIQEAMPKGNRGRRAMLRSDAALKPGQTLLVQSETQKSGATDLISGPGLAAGAHSSMTQHAPLLVACLGGALLSAGAMRFFTAKVAAGQRVSNATESPGYTVVAAPTAIGAMVPVPASPVFSAVSEVRALLQDAAVEMHAVESALAAVRRAAATAIVPPQAVEAVAVSGVAAVAVEADVAIAPPAAPSVEVSSGAPVLVSPAAILDAAVAASTASAAVVAPTTPVSEQPAAAFATEGSAAVASVDLAATAADGAEMQPAAGGEAAATTLPESEATDVAAEVPRPSVWAGRTAFGTAAQVAAAREQVKVALESAYGLMMSVPVRGVTFKEPAPAAQEAPPVAQAPPAAEELDYQPQDVDVGARISASANAPAATASEAPAATASEAPAATASEAPAPDVEVLPLLTAAAAVDVAPGVLATAAAGPPDELLLMASDGALDGGGSALRLDEAPLASLVPEATAVAAAGPPRADPLPLVMAEALNEVSMPMDAVSAGQVLDRIRVINKLLEEEQQRAEQLRLEGPDLQPALDVGEVVPLPAETVAAAAAEAAPAEVVSGVDAPALADLTSALQAEATAQSPAVLESQSAAEAEEADVPFSPVYVGEGNVEYEPAQPSPEELVADRERAEGLLGKIDMLLASFESLSPEDERMLQEVQQEAADRAAAAADRAAAAADRATAAAAVTAAAAAVQGLVKAELLPPPAAAAPSVPVDMAAFSSTDSTTTAKLVFNFPSIPRQPLVGGLPDAAQEAATKLEVASAVAPEVAPMAAPAATLMAEPRVQAAPGREHEATAPPPQPFITAEALEAMVGPLTTTVAGQVLDRIREIGKLLEEDPKQAETPTQAVAPPAVADATAATIAPPVVEAAPEATGEPLAPSDRLATALAVLNESISAAATEVTVATETAADDAAAMPAAMFDDLSGFFSSPRALLSGPKQLAALPPGRAVAGLLTAPPRRAALPPPRPAIRGAGTTATEQQGDLWAAQPPVTVSTVAAAAGAPVLRLMVDQPPAAPVMAIGGQAPPPPPPPPPVTAPPPQFFPPRPPQQPPQPPPVNQTMKRAAAAAAAAAGESRDRPRHDLNAEATLVHLKSGLLDFVYGTARGVSASMGQRAAIEEFVTALELRNPNSMATEAIPVLAGRWKLVYTSNVATLLLLGALDNMPLVDVGDVYQIIDPDTLTATNKIDLAVPMLMSLRAEAGLEVRSPRQFKVRFTKVGLDTYVATPQLMAALEVPDSVTVLGATLDLTPLRRLIAPINSGLEAAQGLLGRAIAPEFAVESVPVPPGLSPGTVTDAASLWMLTTYLDDNLRISRDDEGRVFVMLKDVGIYPEDMPARFPSPR